MVGLIFNDGTVKSASECTREELVKWINEAPDNANRQTRKQLLYAYMYSAGPEDLLKLGKNKQKLLEG